MLGLVGRLSCAQLAALRMNPDFLNRDVNANFSGGEKKRNEILQLSVLEARRPSACPSCLRPWHACAPS